MDTCPDCTGVKKQATGDSRYEIIDIGTHVKYLKEFLKLRDNNPAFDEARLKGAVGIPCFVLEDGSITFSPEETGLGQEAAGTGASCSIDGKGC